MARVIESGQFQNEVADGVIIVDFFATWCGPCKMLSPVFEELGLEMEGKVKFIKIDVDKSPDIASKYSVSTIPTMLILKNGEKQDAMVGFLPKEVIKEKIEKYL
ncbi:MAG: thioredoxin [Clostridiaceae bacterium]|nr:thioredoxin [Clostridiaceae bacterium]